MKIIITVLDTATQVFGQPQFMHTKGEATRSFSDIINAKESNALRDHPDDYEMYEIGTYDEQTGVITPHKKPKLINRGKDLVMKGD